MVLQRGDLDVLHSVLAVKRAWSFPMDGSAVLGLPKTDAGLRMVAVPPNLLPALEDHLASFVGTAADAWLFPREDGKPVSPRTIDRVWNLGRRAAGRPELRFHDLRHSGLTWAAATGATTAESMRRGRHKSPAAALRYQHATEDRDRALASALGRLAIAEVVPI